MRISRGVMLALAMAGAEIAPAQATPMEFPRELCAKPRVVGTARAALDTIAEPLPSED